MAHLVLLDGGEPRRGLELAEHDHHAARVEGDQGRGEPRNVVERGGEQHAAVVLAVGTFVGAHDVASQGAVLEHHALGQGGGAARVQQRRQRVVVDLGEVLDGLGGVAGGGVVAVEVEDVGEGGGPHALDQVAVALLGHQHLGPGVGHEVRGLVLAGPVVHGHDRGAQGGGPEEHLQVGDAVGGEDADPVAGADAERAEEAGCLRHPAAQFAVGDLGPGGGVDDRDLVEADHRGQVEEHGHVHEPDSNQVNAAAQRPPPPAP
jgi:hypothetical protein